jgi:hypothetical protein
VWIETTESVWRRAGLKRDCRDPRKLRRAKRQTALSWKR